MQIKSKHEKYILLATWGLFFSTFEEKEAEAINDMLFHGTMIEVISIFDTCQIDIQSNLIYGKYIKSMLRKDFWPWIFLNRMIGYNSQNGDPLGNRPYFLQIDGMDIFDQYGMLNDFKLLLRSALQVAYTCNQPGIVIDMEHYNDYSAYWINNLSAKLGRTEDEIKVRLVEIGQELGAIIDEEYPEAIIWMLFTDLPNTSRTTSHITKGLLEYANETNAKFKVVTGGELGLGYCHIDTNNLETKIKNRAKRYYPYLKEYSNLKLGAPIAPWLNTGVKYGYWERGICKDSIFTDIFSFNSVLTMLFKYYDYIWLYSSPGLGTNILDDEIRNQINVFLQKSFLYLK